MSITDQLERQRARREAIAGREAEVCKLIGHALTTLHVDHADREDYAQEAWLAILGRATPWDPSRARLSTWVYLVVLTTIRSLAGKARTGKRNGIVVRDSDRQDTDKRGIISRLPDPRPLQETRLAAAEARAVVSEVLRAMGRRVGSPAWVLERYHVDGLTHEEIADRLVRDTGRLRQMLAHKLGWHAHELDERAPWRRLTRTRIQQLRELAEAEFLACLTKQMFPRPAAELAA